MNLQGKRVLITSGPTWVPVDDMRVMSNRSTGALGQLMAKNFHRAGARVTLLEGPVQQPLSDKTVQVIPFQFYDELYRLLKRELKKKNEIVIHAAAVADFRLRVPFAGKIESRKKTVTLKLVPTVKIINRIKHWCPKTLLVGFKLESLLNDCALIKKADSLFDRAKCDLVIANRINPSYQGFIIQKDRQVLAKVTSRQSLTNKLLRILRTLDT